MALKAVRRVYPCWNKLRIHLPPNNLRGFNINHISIQESRKVVSVCSWWWSFQVRNLGMPLNSDVRQCLDSPAGEDLRKAITPYPCHGQGGNQVYLFWGTRCILFTSDIYKLSLKWIKEFFFRECWFFIETFSSFLFFVKFFS